MSSELVLSPLNDGVDHINIYSKGRTELGRFLTNMNNTIVRTDHGEFKSAESYWHWLKFSMIQESESLDVFRRIDCFQSKELSSKFIKSSGDPKGLTELVIKNVTSPKFQDHIKTMLAMKIEDNPKMLALFRENSLPYEHYYYYGQLDNPKVHNLIQYSWITEYLNQLKIE